MFLAAHRSTTLVRRTEAHHPGATGRSAHRDRLSKTIRFPESLTNFLGSRAPAEFLGVLGIWSRQYPWRGLVDTRAVQA